MSHTQRDSRRVLRLIGVALAVMSLAASAQVEPRGLVDDRRLLAASDQTDANWITFGQDYRNQRFSSLTGIDRSNVGRLSPAWIYQTGTVGSTQTQPIVVDGVMYFTTPSCDVIAVDAATGEELWRYRHKFKNDIPRASSNRGVGVGYGKVFMAADDGRVVALDQASGRVIWDVAIPGFDPVGLGQPGNPLPGPIPFVLRAAPLVYDGTIIVGATGFEANDVGDAFVQSEVRASADIGLDWIQANLGRRAFLFALNANTPALDPAMGLIFIGTGNPAPGSLDLVRPGDNLYSNGVVALEAKTGKFRWFFQEHPHGIYDARAGGADRCPA